ncbi:MAG: hypoxanthine-guanine phosphoribosyltransferase [Pseudomonadota bacterium]
MKHTTDEHARQVLRNAECLFTPQQIDGRLQRMAADLNARFAGQSPILLCVMNGGAVLAGQLLPRLDFMLEFDYLHATRYSGDTSGGELVWKRHHELPLHGRDVLILDDILDVGLTLKEIVQACLSEDARSVTTAVLVEKKHAGNCGMKADHVALDVPDRYVFGYGMDYRGFLRNAPGIFSTEEE